MVVDARGYAGDIAEIVLWGQHVAGRECVGKELGRANE